MNNALLNATCRLISHGSDEQKERLFRAMCAEIADGDQAYHEANTPDGWAATLSATPNAAITLAERIARQRCKSPCQDWAAEILAILRPAEPTSAAVAQDGGK